MKSDLGTFFPVIRVGKSVVETFWKNSGFEVANSKAKGWSEK